jgi:hypothetical protein
MQGRAGSKIALLLNWFGIALFSASSAVALLMVSWRTAGPPAPGDVATCVAAAATCLVLLRCLKGQSLLVVLAATALVSLAAAAVAVILPRHSWTASGFGLGLVLGSFTNGSPTSSATVMLRFVLRTISAVLALMLALDERIVATPIVLVGGAAACVAWLLQRGSRGVVG